MRPGILFIATCLFVTCSAVSPAAEPEQLHERIDQMIAKKANGPLAELSDDAEFVRRVYLDLAGRIPSANETRDFLADKSTTKRTSLIDQLLASEEYPRRMKNLFDIMLMERLGTHEDWERFLENAFAENRPWDQITRDIIYPNAEDETTRGAAFFTTQRLTKIGQNPVDVPGLVRDFGRLFLGVDVQCAECHDHLFVDDYKQVDYQGLYAFVGNSFIRRDTEFPAIGETPLLKKVEFQSVFEGEQKSTGPRLPGGEEIPIPVMKKGEEYEVPPDRKTRSPGVVKFSPLKVLSERLPRADNMAFNRNIANRLWWVMMGRGLVHPLDLIHSENPPTHPELLDLLAEEIAAHDFDIKWFIRQLALSQTYQRASTLPSSATGEIPEASYRVALERPLSAEQLLECMLVATGEKSGDQSSEESKAELQEKFADAFANPPRDPEVEIRPSVKAALFVLNDVTVLSWLEPSKGNLADRAVRATDDSQAVDEIYLSVLSRPPSDDERRDAIEYLSQRPDTRAIAVGNLIWALMASTEFAVNH